jgi:hypothetical protein
MKSGIADVVLNLPVDATLASFLLRLGLPVEALDDSMSCSQSILAMIQNAEPPRRARAIAELMVAGQLQTPAGERAALEAATQHPAALAGMAAATGSLHRSFWLYVHHRDLFDAACAMEYLDAHSSQAQQFSTEVKQRPSNDGIAQQGFCWATGLLYQSQLGCGERVVSQLIERSDDVFLLTAYVQDLATLQLEFEGEQLARRVGHPTIHMVLEYCASTGIARALVKGGAKFQQGLVRNFAKHYLNVEIDAKKIQPIALNLTKLRQGVQLPTTNDLGFVAAMVKELTVLSDDRALKLCCTATAASDRAGVTELLKAHLPSDNPVEQGWQVVSATINLYLQQPGKTRTRTVAVEVTSQGRLNLHKYEPAVQEALEAYLVELGVMSHSDTLMPTTLSSQVTGVAAQGSMH